MYEEKRMEFDWKGFLLKLALLIVVIILIIKLLPLNNKSPKELSTEFKNNMATLRIKGNSYFTADKLPVNNEESIKVSLDDLVKVGAIRDLQDADGNSCDINKSYVKATKDHESYELEIYLKCGSEENTTYVYIEERANSNLKVPTTETTKTSKVTTVTKDEKPNHNNGQNNNFSQNNNTQYITSKVIKTVKPASNVSVIFNSNGGTKISTQYIKIGSTSIRPSNPTKAGYIFLGWFYNNREYNFNSPVNSNIILIAKWVPGDYIKPIITTKKTTTTTKRTTTSSIINNRYTVQFNSNGGSYRPYQIVTYGDYATPPIAPVKPNATFVGWYLGNKKYNFNTRVYNNMTLIAKYEVTENYKTIVYSAGWGAKTKVFTVTHKLNTPEMLKNRDYKNVRIDSLKYVKGITTAHDLNNYRLYHSATFDQQSSNFDFTSGTVKNLAYINTAEFTKLSIANSNRTITWKGNVKDQCETSFNFYPVTNACMYGIVYEVNWHYDIIK
ncbi:MAG: InlB B-repeat-containing protein [Bacilli bacterium]|nr:InlB B-repeat-containing protein [Bacilli bacterium]